VEVEVAVETMVVVEELVVTEPASGLREEILFQKAPRAYIPNQIM
jgi:hypothetical protein